MSTEGGDDWLGFHNCPSGAGNPSAFPSGMSSNTQAPKYTTTRLEALEIAVGELSTTVYGNCAEIERFSKDVEHLRDQNLSGLQSPASSVPEDWKSMVLQIMTQTMTAVVKKGAVAYPNKSANLEKDVHTETPFELAEGKKVRLWFPQEKLEDGRVMVAAVHVDAHMNLSTVWLCVCNVITNEKFISDFEP